MLSSSANRATINAIFSSMEQTSRHGIASTSCRDCLICYPSCRSILLPILPVCTLDSLSLSKERVRERSHATIAQKFGAKHPCSELKRPNIYQYVRKHAGRQIPPPEIEH